MIAPELPVKSAGIVVGQIDVMIGPRFLELFSSSLYSSSNKAFEELVSNSWDAGAKTVYVGIPERLSEEDAAIWVLDDGCSMDFEGLRQLWDVATSRKRERPSNGRAPIGKFGIGKLATYLIANQLTFVCKAADGVVRAVTIDYRDIDRKPGHELHIPAHDLNVRELDRVALKSMLDSICDGSEILHIIDEGVPEPSGVSPVTSDFGGVDPPLPPHNGTWTLALMTSLKPAGRKIQLGRMRWLLQTALPLGASISIVLNGEPLESSKINVPVNQE